MGSHFRESWTIAVMAPRQVFVRSVCGKTSTLQLEPSCTIASVKQRLEDEYGIPNKEMRVIFAGKQLHNSCTIEASNVEHDATLHVLLKLQGGTDYICGDCGTKNEIKPKDPIRCRICGYRIMYKMRTKNLIQFEAR